MATKANEEKTAAQVCEERLADIGALLDQIGQEAAAIRKEYTAEDGLDWSMAADLGRGRERLIEAMTAITSFSESEIEATLAELRG